MRLNDQVIGFLKQIFAEKIPDAKIYLFGSRVLDNAAGGDIDLMILTETPVDKRIFRAIRVTFYKAFGWQKIDLVNFTFNDNSVFKQIIMTDCIEL
jgi:Nucleotidyltransferase domain.